MNVTTALYLVDVINSIDNLIGVTWTVYIFCMLGLSGMYTLSIIGREEEQKVIFKKILKMFLGKWWLIAISILISLAIPSKNTMYLMLGTSVLSTSNLPAKVTQAIQLKLDAAIKELQPHESKE